MFCENCGAKLGDTDEFCFQCGQKIRRQPPVQRVEHIEPTESKELKEPRIYFMEGRLRGVSFPVRGEVVIGSDSKRVVIALSDERISPVHCKIAFNAETGCYVVRDISEQGVYLQDESRLEKDAVVSCNRGTVLSLGSKAQMCRLI